MMLVDTTNRGTPDNPTTAIQDAIDGSPQGAQISLSGLYHTKPIRFTLPRDSGKALVGIGGCASHLTAERDWGAILMLGNGQHADVLSIVGEAGQMTSCGVRLDNFRIDGNKMKQSAGGGLFLANVGHVPIGSLYVGNCREHGVYGVRGCAINGFTVDGRLEILSCGGSGLDLGPSSGDAQINMLRVGQCQNNVVLWNGNQVNQIRTFQGAACGVVFETGIRNVIGSIVVNDCPHRADESGWPIVNPEHAGVMIRAGAREYSIGTVHTKSARVVGHNVNRGWIGYSMGK